MKRKSYFSICHTRTFCCISNNFWVIEKNWIFIIAENFVWDSHEVTCLNLLLQYVNLLLVQCAVYSILCGRNFYLLWILQPLRWFLSANQGIYEAHAKSFWIFSSFTTEKLPIFLVQASAANLNSNTKKLVFLPNSNAKNNFSEL